MEEASVRFLEEWKASNDLLKFYEDLKQKRFSHFLTIQTAFLAVFGLVARDTMGHVSMLGLSAIVLISIPPLVISYYCMRVDVRSRAFIETVKGRLLLLEEEWRAACPSEHFSTYTDLLTLLAGRDRDVTARYLRVHTADADDYARLLRSKSAHGSEHAIMRLFWYLWLVLIAAATAVHLAWHVRNGSWAIT